MNLARTPGHVGIRERVALAITVRGLTRAELAARFDVKSHRIGQVLKELKRLGTVETQASDEGIRYRYRERGKHGETNSE